MPIQEFWADSREYFEFQRCGGSMTHLNRILGGMSAMSGFVCPEPPLSFLNFVHQKSML